jgi:hypothetical protein
VSADVLVIDLRHDFRFEQRRLHRALVRNWQHFECVRLVVVYISVLRVALTDVAALVDYT